MQGKLVQEDSCRGGGVHLQDQRPESSDEEWSCLRLLEHLKRLLPSSPHCGDLQPRRRIYPMGPLL
jgi:hypothetical protein